jgi:hypothetical protein
MYNILNLVQINSSLCLTLFLGEYGCPLPCSLSSYKATLQYTHKNAMELFTGIKVDNEFWMYYYYDSMETEINTESLIVDMSNLIGAIGGNMGLFLGFSFLSLFLFTLDFIHEKIK